MNDSTRGQVTARRNANAFRAQKAFNKIRVCAEQGLMDLDLNRPATPVARQIAADVQELLRLLAVMAEQDRTANMMVERAA